MEVKEQRKKKESKKSVSSSKSLNRTIIYAQTPTLQSPQNQKLIVNCDKDFSFIYFLLTFFSVFSLVYGFP